MKDLKVSQSIFNSTKDLLDNYRDCNMPPVHYLQTKEKIHCFKEDEYESIMELFLSVVNHRRFLTDVVNYFYCLDKRRNHSDQHSLIILSHIMISVLNHVNKDDIVKILLNENLKKTVNFLKFFNKKTITEELFLAGCQYFEEDYVVNNIISNVKSNKELLQDILLHFKRLLNSKFDESHRDTTTIVPPNITVNYRSPPVPANTPQAEQVPPPRRVPPSTYNKPKIGTVLAKLKEQHKESSLKQFIGANEKRQQYLQRQDATKHHSCPAPTQEHTLIPPPHPATFKNNVKVKKNATTILREASVLIKSEEKEILRINELMCGAANYTKYEELLDDIRACEEQTRLEEIEKKHLQGLLTREEAILARKNLLELNKAKKAEIDLEKKETEQLLKKMKHEQDEKIKKMIHETQQIQKNIANKKQNLIDKNQRNAQEVAETSRMLYIETMLKQNEEMKKRIEIIKEIKALSHINDFNGNKFDPTETMNLGLLCEMSLVELQERLIVNRASLTEEIRRRKICLQKEKLKQQQFLATTEQFIEACRHHEKVIKDLSRGKCKLNKTIQERQDIVELRQRLQKARSKRMEYNKVE